MKNRIIVALDTPSFAEAQEIVDALPDALFFKVGLQAFLGFGPGIIGYLQDQEKRFFLDLKFHDIPNTVAGAVRSVLQYRPAFLTLHLAGGQEMIAAAVAAAGNSDITLLGVTVLTSLTDADLMDIGFSHTAREMVISLFHLGRNSGIKGFVCSPEEISLLRREGGNDAILVTPGVRPDWAQKNDQKRIFTPARAIANGSDYLVIGRPITHAADRAEAFRRIVTEMEEAARAN